jgi:membrane-associated phospholipid phosphatase
MLEAIRTFDLTIFGFFNSFAGRWREIDLFFAWQQDNFAITGILFMAGFYWFWCYPDAARDDRRSIIINMFPAIFVALVLNRVIALWLPFRERPMYDPSIAFVNPDVDGQIHFNMENWSSFPSDTATYFFTMLAAIWLISRRAAIGYALYAVVFLLVTRIYLGVHYPGDILGGAVLGVVTMLALNRWLGRRVAAPLLSFERTAPHWFYAVGFLVAYEFGVTLIDIRILQHGLLVKAHRWLQGSVATSPEFALPLAVLLGAVLVAAVIRTRRRSQALPRRADWQG